MSEKSTNTEKKEKKLLINPKKKDPSKQSKFSKAINAGLANLSGSISPLLPAMIAGGIFKMVAVLTGPGKLGLLTADSQIYQFLCLANDSVFYFLPFFAAYFAAKRFKSSPLYPLMIAAMMMHPTFAGWIEAAVPFKIYGIFPMQLVNYANGIVPIILCAWFLSVVEKWVDKIVPKNMKTLGVPVLTMFIGYPACLCFFGPVTNWIMAGVTKGIIWMNAHIGFFACIILGALWFILVMFGAQIPIMMALLPTWVEMGFDAIVSPASIASTMALVGVELGYALRASTAKQRETGWASFITHVTANVGTGLYAIAMVDRLALAYTIIGGAVGSAVMFLLGARVTIFTGVGFPWLNFLRFGEAPLLGAVGMLAAFAVPMVLSIVIGFERTKESEEEASVETQNAAAFQN